MQMGTEIYFVYINLLPRSIDCDMKDVSGASIFVREKVSTCAVRQIVSGIGLDLAN